MASTPAPAPLIPDPGLEAAIRAELGKPTGALTKADLAKVRNLDASGCTIRSFEGIKHCTSLERLECCSYDSRSGKATDLAVETVDLSGMTSLMVVALQGRVANLNVSGCTSLLSLDCSIPDYNLPITNGLKTLNVRGCTALHDIQLKKTDLTALDLSGLPNLAYVVCESNDRLKSLNVSGCTALYYLACHLNSLDTLNVRGCTALTTLYCFNNNLASLDVSGNTALTTLWCSNNNLTSLDLRGLASLSDFLHDRSVTVIR